MKLLYQAYYQGKQIGRPMLLREKAALDVCFSNIEWVVIW